MISLDDISNLNLLNPIELNKYIRNKIQDNNEYYIVLDEVQNVITIKNPILTNGKIIKAKKNDEDIISYVNIVLGLIQIPNVDLYITGSNSKFLSSDIITDFRDRGDEIHILPLSFSEFLKEFSGSKEEAYEEYSLHGGMPLSLISANENDKEQYLYNLYSLTYAKDILERHKYKNSIELDTLTKVISSNIGSLIKSNTLVNAFKSNDKSNISKEKIEDYLKSLEESYLIKKVNRFDIKGRKQIGALYKYYFSDIGIRNSRLNFLHKDLGHVMENIIYNELIYRGYSVGIGIIESFSKENNKTIRNTYETDFVVKKGSKFYYIQSAYNINNEEQYDREIRPLVLINDSLQKKL